MNLGHIYVVHTQQTNPPKDKLAVCVCSESNWFLWINTMPRYHGVGQMLLADAEHRALNHESFLDCSRVTMFPVAERSTAIDRGIISEELADRIIEFINTENIKTLSLDQLVKISNNLTALY